jgi:hypothetical protein
VRVRTYGFPGCFTRPPGTSTRHHPHEPTTSKPVVPRDVLPRECTAVGWVSQSAPGNGKGGRDAGNRQKNRRGPKPLEEPGGSGPRAFPCGWRGLTPQWPRSLRLGSASEFKVARGPSVCKGVGRLIPHVPEKSDPGDHGRYDHGYTPLAGRHTKPKTGMRTTNTAKAVRRCLELLPQWGDGQSRDLPAITGAGGCAGVPNAGGCGRLSEPRRGTSTSG